jgi:DNA-binding CsgD family transcriptional regulator
VCLVRMDGRLCGRCGTDPSGEKRSRRCGDDLPDHGCPVRLAERCRSSAGETTRMKARDGEPRVCGPSRQCLRLANDHALSPRETEIMMLLARGRNAERISDILGISSHTAKTHICSIYRKLDVHSPQELLDMVESCAPEGSRPGVRARSARRRAG